MVGPKSVDLCAEILRTAWSSPVLAGPRYVAAVKERIAAVRRARGLPENFEIVVYALASVGEDRAAARAKVRPVTAFYLEAMGPTLITGVYDANEALAAMIEAGGATAIEVRHAGRLAGLARGRRPAGRLPRQHRGALRGRRHPGRALRGSLPKSCRRSWRFSGARCFRVSREPLI